MINMQSCWFICYCLWCTSGLRQWIMNFRKLEIALDLHLKRKMGKYFYVTWQNTLSLLNKGGKLQHGSPCTVSVVLSLIFRVITPSSHISDPSCPGCSSCFISFPLPCGQEMAGVHGYTNSGGAGRKWSHCSTCNQEIEQPPGSVRSQRHIQTCITRRHPATSPTAVGTRTITQETSALKSTQNRIVIISHMYTQ